MPKNRSVFACRYSTSPARSEVSCVETAPSYSRRGIFDSGGFVSHVTTGGIAPAGTPSSRHAASRPYGGVLAGVEEAATHPPPLCPRHDFQPNREVCLAFGQPLPKDASW